MTDEACKNCGASRLGPYCASCGQRFEDHAPSLRHFLHDFLHDVAHFDVGFFKSLRPLVLAPGLLTAEYLAGRRARYLRPLQTFMIVNLLFFLVGPSFGLLAYRLQPDASGRFFGGGDPRQAIAEAKMRRSHESPAQFAARFDESEAHWRKALVILLVPPFALVAFALQRRRAPYYVDHLAFALHFYSFFLIALVAVGLAAAGGAIALSRLSGHAIHSVGDAVLVPALVAACWAYLALAVRRAYGAPTATAIRQGLVLTGTTLLLTPLYALAVMTSTLLAM